MIMFDTPDGEVDCQYAGVDWDDLCAAIHMLHEQAHGNTPIKTCYTEPCGHLPIEIVNWQGSVPTTLAGVAR